MWHFKKQKPQTHFTSFQSLTYFKDAPHIFVRDIKPILSTKSNSHGGGKMFARVLLSQTAIEVWHDWMVNVTKNNPEPTCKYVISLNVELILSTFKLWVCFLKRRHSILQTKKNSLCLYVTVGKINIINLDYMEQKKIFYIYLFWSPKIKQTKW